jgi:hypothetical protein
MAALRKRPKAESPTFANSELGTWSGAEYRRFRNAEKEQAVVSE